MSSPCAGDLPSLDRERPVQTFKGLVCDLAPCSACFLTGIPPPRKLVGATKDDQTSAFSIVRHFLPPFDLAAMVAPGLTVSSNVMLSRPSDFMARISPTHVAMNMSATKPSRLTMSRPY